MAAHLTFDEVSRANLERCMEWHPGGLNEWSMTDWACAMAGEAGEVCNAIKKLRRLEDGVPSANNEADTELAIDKIATEIGDTFIYLDLLAQSLGIDMATAVRDTFNRVSEREGFPYRLEAEASA